MAESLNLSIGWRQHGGVAGGLEGSVGIEMAAIRPALALGFSGGGGSPMK